LTFPGHSKNWRVFTILPSCYLLALLYLILTEISILADNPSPNTFTMKRKINLVLAITSIMTVNMVTAAKPDHSINTVNNHATYYSDSLPSETITTIAATGLPQKLLANFKRNFPAATNSQWTRTSTTFFVNFSVNGNTAMAMFNTKGKLNYALINESATDLPLSIQQMIQKNYASYTILSVKKVRIPGIVNYKVLLTDHKQYIDLHVTQDGQIQQAKQMTMPS
jgi:hypothetical protein